MKDKDVLRILTAILNVSHPHLGYGKSSASFKGALDYARDMLEVNGRLRDIQDALAEGDRAALAEAIDALECADVQWSVPPKGRRK